MLIPNPAARFAEDASRFEELSPAELSELEALAPTELAPFPLPRPSARHFPSPVAGSPPRPPPLRTAPSSALGTGGTGQEQVAVDAFPSVGLAEHFSMLPIDSTTMRVGFMTMPSTGKRKFRSPELCAKAAADAFPQDLEAYYRTPHKDTEPAKKKRGALFPDDLE